MAGSAPAAGQSVSDPIDDPISCTTGKATTGLLPAVVDVISIEIRKQNDDLIATIEFRGDPAPGDSVSGGILAFDPAGFDPDASSDWHFDNAGNVLFGYSGDAVSTRTAKSVVDSLGAWIPDTTSSFSATRAGNVVIVRIPGSELGPGSLWLAFATSRLFELQPRCDLAGGDKNGLPILEIPQLVATEDQFEAAGNVQITIPASEGLLSNDIDATIVSDAEKSSKRGGAVAVDTTGRFSYDPAPGFSGTDSFSYTATDGKGGVSTAVVTIQVGPALWFVNAAASGPGSGRWSAPFPDLRSLALVNGTSSGPKPSDAILIFGNAEYQSGLVLDSGQVVVGQGIDMLAALQADGYSLPPHSDVLADPPPISEAPVLISDSLNAIELAQDNRIVGLMIDDTPLGVAIHGDSVSSLVVSDVTIRGKGGVIDVRNGTVDVVLDSVSSDSAFADAIRLRSVDGRLSALTPVTVTSPGRNGVSITGGGVEVEFPELHIFGADSGTAVTIEESASGRRSFELVNISSTAGQGFVIADGGELHIGSGTIQTGGSALDLRSVLLDATLDSLSASGNHGLRLVSVSGSLSIGGRTRIDSTMSDGLNVEDSAVRLAFDNLAIGRADSAFGLSILNSTGSTMDVQRLGIENPVGGGMKIQGIDSVVIDRGSVKAAGGRSVDLRDVVANVHLDSLAADSADAGIVLNNVGGSFEVGGIDAEGRAGRIERMSGRAVDASDVARVTLRDMDLSDIAADAVHLEHFGEVTLKGLSIQNVDSASIKAFAGGKLEITQSSITNARTGIESYEIDDLLLTGNSIVETDTTAVLVSTENPGASTAKFVARQAGDLHARVFQNEVLTNALEGIFVEAKSGSLRLGLAGNNATASANDYVLVSGDSATLMLDGFAGGDADAVTTYLQRVNTGLPRVRVEGTIDPGLGGQADIVAIDKTVSDPEPLPERMIQYRLRVTNHGPSPAVAVVLTDSLPDGLAFVPATITLNGTLLTDASDDDAADFGATQDRTVTVQLGDLSIADTMIVTFAARPQQAFAGASVMNSASITADSPDSLASDNQAEVAISIKLNTATDGNEVPTAFALRQNYPNPFNPSTTIEFDVPSRSFVRLTVLNVLGQVVEQLVAREMNPGRYDVRWDAADGHGVTSGLYFYRLEAGRFSETRRMILLK
jgi:uncharacterized repeat protein (TIGR01451 family)